MTLIRADIVGHRGARFEAPENTIPGFRHALALDLRAVEFDVRMSADGVFVVIHDATVDRTTNGSGPVARHTAAQLAALDARGEFIALEPVGVPTLDEVFDVVSDLPTLLIEIKPDDLTRIAPIVAGVLDRVRDRNLGDRAIVTSFQAEVLAEVQRRAPDQRRGYIGDGSPELIARALELGCFQVDLPHARSTAAHVEAAHAAGLRVIGWPCNSAADLATLRDWGVDAVTSDRPTLIVGLLGA